MVVTRVWPQPGQPLDADGLYGRAGLYGQADRPVPPDRPYVVVNMVTGVDGATAVGGVTKALGSPTDRAIFLHLRDVADAIIVGASTIRAERYGPARPSPEVMARRRHDGQSPRPPIVGVSRRIDFQWETPFFTDADPRPILLVPADADPEKLAEARHSADVITAGEGGVDMVAGLSELRRRGVNILLCEGGPTLNSQLLAAGLVDELCLTVAPTIAGGSGPAGIFHGPGTGAPRALSVAHILEEDDFLYLRYHALAPEGSEAQASAAQGSADQGSADQG
jgi:riboflavin-specific deaminase-like protein